jgi:hypothetical protein
MFAVSTPHSICKELFRYGKEVELMYGSSGTLPATGGVSLLGLAGYYGLWAFIWVFVIIVALGALWNIVPRRES